MKKLTWWCRIVGGLNLLLGLSNLYYVLAAPSVLADTLPYADKAQMAKVYADAWFPFAADLVIIGIALIWVSWHPERNLGVVWLAIAGEATHGIAHDLFLVGRGYEAAGYVAFAAVELVVIVIGALFALKVGRDAARARAEAEAALAATSSSSPSTGASTSTPGLAPA